MSTTDLWMRDIVTYYGSVLFGFMIVAWILARQWNRFKEHLFRTYLLSFEAECADLAAPYKKQLFEPLRKIESNDEILRSIGRIRILEIGVKTGAIEFFRYTYVDE